MQKINFLKEIKKRSAGDKQFERELIDIIIRQTSEQLLKIEGCLNNTYWVEIKTHIHKLHSTFLLLKIPRAIELAESVRKTSGVNTETTKKEVNELVIICNQIITELKKYHAI
jgi:HPt (histidine-containing phosphotransfer) domain-containing protein